MNQSPSPLSARAVTPRRFTAVFGIALACLASPASGATPAEVLANSAATDWRAPAPDQTLVMELSGQRQVVIELAAALAPRHASRIATLTRAHWYDGLAIVRVQDNYVTQWGDADGTHPLPAGITKSLPAEFSQPRLPTGMAYRELPDRDAYARHVGMAAGWPVAMNNRRGPVWMAHCYGMVGAGRDAEADSGGAGELYAVIGHGPRHLDLNITLVGRVLLGMEHLAALPRGTEALGFYKTPAERTRIVSSRMLDELPAAERPAIEVLRTEGPAYTAWLQARRNRKDDWYLHAAGHIDLCNALPPVRVR
jgi:peptidylprolyl isomerase